MDPARRLGSRWRAFVFSLALARLGFACGDGAPATEVGSSFVAVDASAPSVDAGYGHALDGAALHSARIYVSMAATNDIWVLDEQSRQVVRKIGVGQGPAILLGARDREHLYTANWTDDSVSLVDVARGTARTIALSGRPYALALSPDDRLLYAGVTPSSIQVIDTNSGALLRALPTDELAAAIAVSPDGALLYVTELARGTLRAVSSASGAVVKGPIEVGTTPAWIAMTPDGSKLYTLNYSSDDIGVVDSESFTLWKRIFTGAGSAGLTGHVTPDGARLYATNYGSGDLIAIDTSRDELVQRIALDGRPVAVHFSHDGERVYVTDYGAGSLAAPPSANATFLSTGEFTPMWPGQVSVFDVKSGRRLRDTLAVGAGPNGVVIDSL